MDSPPKANGLWRNSTATAVGRTLIHRFPERASAYWSDPGMTLSNQASPDHGDRGSTSSILLVTACRVLPA
jgi:hypothetical protein